MSFLPNVIIRSSPFVLSLVVRQSINLYLPKVQHFSRFYKTNFPLSSKFFCNAQSPFTIHTLVYQEYCIPYRTRIINQNRHQSNFNKNSFLFRRFINQKNSFGTHATKNEWEELQKLPLMKRMHVMFKKYWYVAIPLHCINSAIWFLAFFLLAKCGVNGTYVINWIQFYIIDSQICPQFIKGIFEKDADKLGNLAVALLLYKISTPGRYATTVFGTVYLLRHLLKKGVLVKSANEQLKSVRNSYISHAMNRNIQKQKDRFKKMKKTIKSRSKHK